MAGSGTGFFYSQPSAGGGASYVDPASHPGQYPLTVGSVTFATSECPDNLEFGLSAHMHVTDLIGGGRVIQTFGTHPATVTWDGRIWQQNVEARISSLRQMLVAQSEVLLTWKTERYYCVVREFKAKRLAIDATYSLSVEVTRDANGTASTAAPVSVDDQVTALLTTAEAQAAAIAAQDATGGASIMQQVTNVQGALAGAGPVSQLTGSNLTSVLNVVQSAQNAVTAYSGFLGPLAPQFMSATQLGTTLGLIARNVTQGQSASTITVVGGSLAEIASMHFGDPDLWPQLAAANGISGVRLPPGVTTTLNLPPFPVTAGS